MSSNSSMSGISLVVLMAMSAVMASTQADAAYRGAEVLPGGRDVVVGGVYWGAGASDPAVPHTLYIERIGGGERRVFKQFTGRITDFKAAPIGGLLAVNEVVRETGVSPDRANVVTREYLNDRQVEFYDHLDSKLVILGADGSVRGSISDVHRFAWDPEGEQVVYVTGTENEDGYVVSSGTWIYDIGTRTSRRIHAAGDDVAWPDWDGNVYISGQVLTSGRVGVVKHDPATGVTTETSRKGIHFSPDGRHYFRGASEGDPGGEVFLTAGDVPVELDMAIEESGRKGRAIVRGWFSSSQVIAASAIPGAPVDYLIDVVTGSKQRLDGELLNSDGRSDRTWILNGTSISERSLR